MRVVTLICFLIILKWANAQYEVVKNQLPESSIANSFFETEGIANGYYRFGFVSSDGTKREESGGFDDNQNYVVTGYYSYLDESGKLYFVRYSADKNGFHFLPVPVDQVGFPVAAYKPPPQIVAALLG